MQKGPNIFNIAWLWAILKKLGPIMICKSRVLSLTQVHLLYIVKSWRHFGPWNVHWPNWNYVCFNSTHEPPISAEWVHFTWVSLSLFSIRVGVSSKTTWVTIGGPTRLELTVLKNCQNVMLCQPKLLLPSLVSFSEGELTSFTRPFFVDGCSTEDPFLFSSVSTCRRFAIELYSWVRSPTQS